MSKIGNELIQSLEEAAAFVKGTGVKANYRVHVPSDLDVKAIRTKLKLTQAAFAERFGFSVKNIRNWEQGARQPEGPARAYLVVIGQDPEAVQRALSRHRAA